MLNHRDYLQMPGRPLRIAVGDGVRCGEFTDRRSVYDRDIDTLPLLRPLRARTRLCPRKSCRLAVQRGLGTRKLALSAGDFVPAGFCEVGISPERTVLLATSCSIKWWSPSVEMRTNNFFPSTQQLHKLSQWPPVSGSVSFQIHRLSSMYSHEMQLLAHPLASAAR